MSIFITIPLALALVALGLCTLGFWPLVTGAAATFLFGLTLIVALLNLIARSDDNTAL
jgi:hypothetical protein